MGFFFPILIYQFLTIVSILYPLKTLEIQSFSLVLRGYELRILTRNGLLPFHNPKKHQKTRFFVPSTRRNRNCILWGSVEEWVNNKYLTTPKEVLSDSLFLNSSSSVSVNSFKFPSSNLSSIFDPCSLISSRRNRVA